jgi:hypothetical protein
MFYLPRFAHAGAERLLERVELEVPAPVFRARLKLLHLRDPALYSGADPFKVIHVPPQDICQFASRPAPSADGERIVLDRKGRFHKWANVGVVVDGDWDRHVQPYDTGFYQAARAHFLEGVAWKDTPFVAETIAAVRSGASRWHSCRTPDDVLRRCAEVEELYISISTNGYRPSPAPSFFRWKKLVDEIVVNIGRDGRLIHNSCGNHRLAVAKILKLDSVPVRVLLRHRRWQAVRREFSHCARVSDLSDEARAYLHHPDLQDCLHPQLSDRT